MTYDPALIRALPDGQFQDFVTRHLHPETGDPAAWELLTSAALLERTTTLLKDMKQRAFNAAIRKEAEAQAAKLRCLPLGAVGRQEGLRIDSEWKAWKARNGGFQRLVDGRLAQVKATRKSDLAEQLDVDHAHARKVARLRENLRTASDKAEAYRDAIRRLALRIHRHQALTAASRRDPEQHDYDLWRLLDEINLPVDADSATASLRHAAQTFWFETSEATPAHGQQQRTERLMRQAPAGRSERFEGSPKARRVAPPTFLA